MPHVHVEMLGGKANLCCPYSKLCFEVGAMQFDRISKSATIYFYKEIYDDKSIKSFASLQSPKCPCQIEFQVCCHLYGIYTVHPR
jgi:hypothetical protein